MSTTATELARQRDHACRLTPDRALGEFDEALAFLGERGMLTMTPDSALPSLFGACHEEPYSDKPGYGQYPKTRWWWGGAMAVSPGVVTTKLHRGRRLYLSEPVATAIDPRCRWELEQAGSGHHGEDAAALVAHLLAAGPSIVEDVKAELGCDAKRLRSVRDRLEKVGVLLAPPVQIDTPDGGHRHTAELRRWDQGQVAAGAHDHDEALARLVVAGVAAAVVAPDDEVSRRWFSWKVPPVMIDELLETGDLRRPAPGQLAVGTGL